MADTLLGSWEFRDLVSGRRRGVAASLARGALSLLEWPYTAAVNRRNRRYDSGRAEVHQMPVPVVSVGNLTLGGTGKTPTVEWVARWFRDRGVRVGLVSRGYGAQAGQLNDEALELAQKLPDVPHVQDADRVRGARQAIEKYGCQVLVLDDALQHRRIARDLNIVLIDALEPFGFGHVFPRGTLREPLAGWSRADVLLLTRAEAVDQEQRAQICQQVRKYSPVAAWVEATHAPRNLLDAKGRELPLAMLSGARVAAFCGIGNPAGFLRALAGCGCQIDGSRELADHFAYPPSELTALRTWIDGLGVPLAVCTCKDLVKIGERWKATTPLVALSSQLEILTGQNQLEAALAPLAERALAAGT